MSYAINLNLLSNVPPNLTYELPFWSIYVSAGNSSAGFSTAVDNFLTYTNNTVFSDSDGTDFYNEFTSDPLQYLDSIWQERFAKYVLENSENPNNILVGEMTLQTSIQLQYVTIGSQLVVEQTQKVTNSLNLLLQAQIALGDLVTYYNDKSEPEASWEETPVDYNMRAQLDFESNLTLDDYEVVFGDTKNYTLDGVSYNLYNFLEQIKNELEGNSSTLYSSDGLSEESMIATIDDVLDSLEPYYTRLLPTEDTFDTAVFGFDSGERDRASGFINYAKDTSTLDPDGNYYKTENLEISDAVSKQTAYEYWKTYWQANLDPRIRTTSTDPTPYRTNSTETIFNGEPLSKDSGYFEDYLGTSKSWDDILEQYATQKTFSGDHWIVAVQHPPGQISIDQRLRACMAAGRNLDTNSRIQLKKAMWFYEEFFKSAGDLIAKINTVIRKSSGRIA